MENRKVTASASLDRLVPAASSDGSDVSRHPFERLTSTRSRDGRRVLMDAGQHVPFVVVEGEHGCREELQLLLLDVRGQRVVLAPVKDSVCHRGAQSPVLVFERP